MEQEREERRKKIKALEASLFGPDNEWTSKSVDLPELKNVNEYTTRLEAVETRKATQTANLTRLKTAPKPKKSSMILQALADTRRAIKSPAATNSEFDNIGLLTDDQLDDQTFKETEVNSSGVQTSRQQRHIESIRPIMSKSQRILKSEVAQLDDAFNKIFYEEPQQSMLDNLKKKHGLNNNKYERFDQAPDQIQVQQALNQKMNRARILESLPKNHEKTAVRLRRASFHNQPDLSVIGQQISSKPNITVDQAPKPKRSMPVQLDKNRLSVGEVEGLISYAQLEKIPSKFEDQQAYGEACQGTFDAMPTNTFADMPPRTFEDIPADIFDHIPRAVTAREERRLLKLQEKLVQERLEKKDHQEKHCNKKVSFIAALFKPHQSMAADEQGSPNSGADDGDADLMAAAAGGACATKKKLAKEHEGDFLFALFIAQEEESTLANEAVPNKQGTSSSPTSSDSESSSAIGHFCAPFSPGFCEANFCIFHHPKAQ